MKTIKNIITLFLTSVVIVACNSKSDLKNQEYYNKNNIVSKFIKDVKSLESDTNTNPIVAFKQLAEEIADNKIIVSKNNIKKVLIKSKDYSNTVIVTADHTIVKIKNLEDCQESGSWNTCMPSVEGYIKKGKLKYKKDYMNNVIGKADGQDRIAYFFSSDQSFKSIFEPNAVDSSKIIQEICYSEFSSDRTSPCNEMDLAINRITGSDSILVVESYCGCGSPCLINLLSTHNKNGKLIDIISVYTNCDCPPSEVCGWNKLEIINETTFQITEVSEAVIPKYDDEGNELEFNRDEEFEKNIIRDYKYKTYAINTNGKMELTKSYIEKDKK